MLVGELDDSDMALVFVRTKRGADRLVKRLAREGVRAVAMHGDKSQSQRERALAAFRDGSVRTLVATDIAARGIDVEGITHVVNFDLPNVPETYVHRIGRTARAGADGVAISFCDAEEAAFLRDIEKLIRIAIPATGRAAPRGHRQPVTGDGQGRPPAAGTNRPPRDRGSPGRRREYPKTGDGDYGIASVAFLQRGA